MNIYFCPKTVGDVFLHNLSQPLLKDAVVFNTVELVGWIELRLGLHLESESMFGFHKTYHGAIMNYFKQNPINELSLCYRDISDVPEDEVFQWRCELSTTDEDDSMFSASMVLEEDDLFGNVDWDSDNLDSDDSAFYGLLKAVVGIEEFYSEKTKMTFENRLAIVNNDLCSSKVDFSEDVIYLPCELELLEPDVKELLTKLRDVHGTQLVHKEFTTESCFNLAKVRELIANSQEGNSGMTDAANSANRNQPDTTAECSDSGDMNVPKIQVDFSPVEYILTKIGERYPLTGGWGYSADSAVEILLENESQSIRFEHWFIQFRSEMELNGFENKSDEYENIECTDVKQSLKEINGKKYDVITYTVKAISVTARRLFIKEREEYINELTRRPMDKNEIWEKIQEVQMEERNDENYSIRYQRECLFDVAHFFGKF